MCAVIVYVWDADAAMCAVTASVWAVTAAVWDVTVIVRTAASWPRCYHNVAYKKTKKYGAIQRTPGESGKSFKNGFAIFSWAVTVGSKGYE